MNVRPEWIFDDSPLADPHGFGERAVTFIRKLRHPKSGKPFQLDRWQERIVRRVYGDTVDGRRRIRTVYLRVGRGNRKTSLVAALGLMHLVSPDFRTPGGLGIVAASDRDQAKLTWQEAVGLISTSPTLAKATNKWEAPTFKVNHPKSGSEFVAISSDGDSKHGKTPAFVVTDEIHAWQGRKLWAALTTGLVKVPGTLLLITTTAGAGQDGLAFQVEKYARAVATGEIDDSSYLPIIFETPDEFDWLDEKGWFQANPGLSLGYPDITGLRSLARQAKHVPAAKAEFQQYHLNRWQDAALSPWLDMAIYDEGGTDTLDIEDYAERPCWAGLDYSLVSDVTFLSLIFPQEDGTYAAFGYAFLPEDGIARKEEQDRVPYREWADSGLLILTPGNVIDKSVIADKIREIAENYDLRELAYDPYKLSDTMAVLNDEGIPVVAFSQGWKTMSPAVESAQEIILAGKLKHSGHPIMRRHFAAVVTRSDANNNQSFHKSKSISKIDAAVATTMALHRAKGGDSGMSIYVDEQSRPSGLIFI
ncbi:terminase large subunit [Mesorhizobium sp. IMUNJ 23232]|uniref:terminase large subunit n=1 Tax=Mesorhizobium sp. IMUNJ 23232 TaxID=3376064 RepID=UPI0037BAE158